MASIEARGDAAGAILERLPVSGWHRKIVVLVGLGSFFDLYEVFLGGVLAPTLAAQFALGATGRAAVIGAGFLGMFVGANVLSVLADRLGRRRVFLLNLLTYSLFSLATAFSPNIEVFLLLRFLSGIGLGAELVLVDTYLAEFMPAKVRGRYIAWAYTVGFCGVPLVALLGGQLVAKSTILGLDGWRWLFIFGGLGAVLVLLIRRALPESPRWLASRGREDEAMEVARSIAAQSGTPEPEPSPEAEPEPPPRAPERTGGKERSTVEVLRIAFTGVYRNRMIMLVIFQILQTVAYYGFGQLAPTALEQKDIEVTKSLSYLAISFAGYPIGSLISVPLVERFERKWLIVYSAIAIAVFGIVFAAATDPVLIITAGFLVTAASNVFSNAFHIYQAEIFPTSIRSTASGIAYSLSRGTSAVLPFIAVPLLLTVGPVWVFGGAAVLIALLCVDVGVLGPRAATGQTLEEVR